MNVELNFLGKKHIPARRAAKLFGYSEDYVSELVRKGKVVGQLVSRTWYVSEESLIAYKAVAIESTIKHKKSFLRVGETSERTLSTLTPETFTSGARSKNSPLSYMVDERPLLPELKKHNVRSGVTAPQRIKKVSVPRDVDTEFFIKKIIPSHLFGFRNKLLAHTISLMLVTSVVWASDVGRVVSAYESAVRGVEYAGREIVDGYVSLQDTLSHLSLASVVTAIPVRDFNIGERIALGVYETFSPLFGVGKNFFASLFGNSVQDDAIAFDTSESDTVRVALEKFDRPQQAVPAIATSSTPTDVDVAFNTTDVGQMIPEADSKEPFVAPSNTSQSQAFESVRIISSGITLADVNREVAQAIARLEAEIRDIRTVNSVNRQNTRSVFESIDLGNIRDANVIDANITGSTFSGSSITTDSLNTTGTGVNAILGSTYFDTDTLVIDSTNRRVGISTTSPRATLHIDGTDGLIIPSGTTAQRAGSPYIGTVRYNTSTSQFEGYSGSTWGSLGGLIDVDQDTYVSAEDSPGTDNDQLKFFTFGSQRMIIGATGNVGIGTTSPFAKLSVNSFGGAQPQFVIASSTGSGATTTSLIVDMFGNIGIGTSNPASRLTLEGGSFFQAGGSVTSSSTPTLIGGVKDDSLLALPQDVFISDRYAYVVNAVDDSLRIIDVSNPAAPVIVGGVKDASLLNSPISVAVANRYAYVVNNVDNSLRIIDVSNPAAPVIVGGVKDNSLLAGVQSVSVSGRYAYVANNGDHSLRIIDVSNPAAPVIVGGVKDTSLLNGITSVTVLGRYVYATNYTDDSLRIIDVSNPAAPVIVGGVKDTSLLDGLTSAFVSGRYAYVTSNNNNSLRIIDVSNPAAPVIVGGVKDNSLLAGAQSVSVSGRYAYVTNYTDDSLRIIDVSNPAAPVIVGGVKSTSLLDGAVSVFISGRYAYTVNANNSSLRIIDISGIEAQSALVHSLEAGTLQTQSNVLVGNNLLVSNGLNIGNDAMVGGTLTVSNMSSTTISNYNPVAAVFLRGNVGIGTTSPWAQFSVNPNGIPGPSFAVGSSTRTALVVTQAGNVGIGTSNPTGALTIGSGQILVPDGSASAPSIALTGSPSTGIFGFGAGTRLSVSVGSSESARLQTGAILLSPETGTYSTNTFARLTVQSQTASLATQLGVLYASSDTNGATIDSRKSRGTLTSHSEITSGDNLLKIGAFGYVGVGSTFQEAAQIKFDSTGTISNSATGIAGIMRFLTADTGSEPTERLTILNSGNIGIGNTSPATRLDITNSATSSAIISLRDPLGNVSLELRAGTSTLNNTFVGLDAGKVNTTGQFNTALGYRSLLSNTTGIQNTANGSLTLAFNTTGVQNIANGVQALYSNTTGSSNTAIGVQALFSNISATSSTAVGYQAARSGADYSNQGGVYLGYQSGYSASTGSDYNTLLGYQSGFGITTGSNNIWLGSATSSTAIANLTTGSQNILIGNNISLPSATASGQLNIGNIIFGTNITGTGSTISSGNIGIGTTTPWGQFSVNPNGITGPSFSVGSSTKTDFVVMNSGKVGIGITNPIQQLSVNSSGATYIQTITSSASNDTGIVMSANSQHWYVRNNGGLNAPNNRLVIHDGTNEVMTMLVGGNVGIGTTTPVSTLSIQGSLCVRDTGSCGTTAGTIYATTATITDIDLAENYQTTDATLMAGEIVSIDPSNPTYIRRASESDTTPLLGIISTAPGILLGKEISNSKPVALSGRVPVKVNLLGGDIAVGDRIALSAVDGEGRRVTGSEETVGIALESFTSTSTTDRIEVFVNLRHHVDTSQFTIDASGNIGIGTTTPAYKLHVLGDVAAQSFVNISTRSSKKDIEYLDDTEKTSILERIRTVGVATYKYTDETESDSTHLGLIAEEAPVEVLATGGKGVDIYKLSTFILAGVQEQQNQIEALQARFASLDTTVSNLSIELASTTSALASTTLDLTTRLDATASLVASLLAQASSSPRSNLGEDVPATGTQTVVWSSDLGTQILSFFQSVGLRIENGVAYIRSIVVDSFVAKSVQTDTLSVNEKVCVDDICVTKEQFKAMLISSGGVTTNPPVTTVVETPTSDTGTSTEVLNDGQQTTETTGNTETTSTTTAETTESTEIQGNTDTTGATTTTETIQTTENTEPTPEPVPEPTLTPEPTSTEPVTEPTS